MPQQAKWSSWLGDLEAIFIAWLSGGGGALYNMILPTRTTLGCGVCVGCAVGACACVMTHLKLFIFAIFGI
jgi:hypothetical protein